jgi:biopolymer transport protein ExbB
MAVEEGAQVGLDETEIAAPLKVKPAALERGLAFLGTLGNNAPFVGLFGTVLGIIRSFRDLANNTTQGASAVMAGIAEALVATAVGLLVALPAVALFNYFQRYIRAQVSGAQALTHLVLAYGKSNGTAGEPQARPALVGR